MPSRRTYFAWHSWIGLTFGLMLFVICWSGTIAVFSHEIDWLLNPDLRANVANAPIDWQAAHDAVRSAYPDWTIREINAPRHAGFAMEVLAQPEPDKDFRVYVDPVTYQVLGDTSYFNVQRFFRSFHMALFHVDSHGAEFDILGVPLGYIAVALMSIPLLISITLPLIFYKRWWRSFFKLERRRGRKVFWSDAHKLTGLWSMLVGLVIALTGMWYLAEWWIPEPPYFEAKAPIAAPFASIEALVANATAASPQLQIRSLYMPEANNGLFMAIGQDDTVLVRDSASVTLNAATGAVLDKTSPSKGGLYVRLFDTADPLHFGNFAGLLSQAFYFIFGLGLSGLSLTGAYLQAKRQQRKIGERSLRQPILLAYGLTTALLGFAAYGAAAEIKGYGIGRDWPEILTPVAVFIGLWCASTLFALTMWIRRLV
jgi:uncharacterized iron-regulated membrane protein